MYVVILAGGGGTRLRPLSTADRPKPFLPLAGERSLLRMTVDRVLGGGAEGDTLGLAPADVTVLVAERYAAAVRAEVPEVRVLTEPAGRNTAPAIALAAAAIDRPAGEVMAVLPADHLIRDEGRFRAILAAAATGLAGGAFGIEAPLVTLGVAPDRPAIEYGYLLPDRRRGPAAAATAIDGAPATDPPEAARLAAEAAESTDPTDAARLAAHPLLAFEEKPTPERAAELIALPGTAWNAGMFLWQRRAILDALAAHAPAVLDAIHGGLAAGRLEAAYDAIEGALARSIDYAVMEPAARAGRVVMGRLDAGWSDIGTWPALLEANGLGGIDGRVVEAGETVAVGPDDLVVRRAGGALVAGPGPGGTMTPDAPIALLTGARDRRAAIAAILNRCAAREVAT